MNAQPGNNLFPAPFRPVGKLDIFHDASLCPVRAGNRDRIPGRTVTHDEIITFPFERNGIGTYILAETHRILPGSLANNILPVPEIKQVNVIPVSAVNAVVALPGVKRFISRIVSVRSEFRQTIRAVRSETSTGKKINIFSRPDRAVRKLNALYNHRTAETVLICYGIILPVTDNQIRAVGHINIRRRIRINASRPFQRNVFGFYPGTENNPVMLILAKVAPSQRYSVIAVAFIENINVIPVSAVNAVVALPGVKRFISRIPFACPVTSHILAGVSSENINRTGVNLLSVPHGSVGKHDILLYNSPVTRLNSNRIIVPVTDNHIAAGTLVYIAGTFEHQIVGRHPLPENNPVTAASFIYRVVPVTKIKHVNIIAVPAGKRIIAPAAVKHIIPLSTADAVIAVAAVKNLVIVINCRRIVRPHDAAPVRSIMNAGKLFYVFQIPDRAVGKRDILNKKTSAGILISILHSYRIILPATDKQVIALAPHRHIPGTDPFPENNRVIAVFVRHRVVPVAPVKHIRVIALAAAKPVNARAADKHIIAAVAGKPIIAFFPEQNIIPVASDNTVISRARVNLVVPVARTDLVVALSRIENLAARIKLRRRIRLHIIRKPRARANRHPLHDIIQIPNRAVRKLETLHKIRAIPVVAVSVFHDNAVRIRIPDKQILIINPFHRNIFRLHASPEHNPVAAADLGNLILPAARSEHVNIIAVPADKQIIAGFPAQNIIAVPAVQRIVARAPVKPVIAQIAHKNIIARRAEKLIIPVAPVKLIIPLIAVKSIVAPLAVNAIRSLIPDKKLRIVFPDNILRLGNISAVKLIAILSELLKPPAHGRIRNRPAHDAQIKTDPETDRSADPRTNHSSQPGAPAGKQSPQT